MIEPSYRDYLGEDGKLTVKLIKALYGCAEAARLWHQLLTSTLVSIGFVSNPCDPCVLNKTEGGVQITVVLYVDDIKITCKDRRKIMEVYDHLVTTFKEVTINESNVCSYLSMTFDFSTRRTVHVTMIAYIEDMLRGLGGESTSVTPASEHLFELRESPPLAKDKANLFHTWTAKLLYLSKRTRPDILTAISFLTTRVKEPTEDDWTKLERVMKYLNGSKDLGVTLDASSDKPLELQAWVDASFATHEDAKGHTGLIIALGNGPIFASSTKQKLVSKSSTESELIGISDSLSQVIWSREFMVGQG